jgi:hypothetical protein
MVLHFWVAGGKGRRLLADIFIGMIPYNQGLQLKWRWGRNTISKDFRVGV